MTRLAARATQAILAAAVVAAVAGIAAATAERPRTAATAAAVSVFVPGSPAVRGGEVVGPPSASTDVSGFAYPDDGSVVRIGSVSSSVAAQPGSSASAQALNSSLAVSLFDGEITAETVETRATAAAGSVTATADTSASHIDGLVVLGQQVAASSNAQLPLADWGMLELLVGSTETVAVTKDERAGRASIVGLRVRVLLAHGGLPAGSEIDVAVARADAAASSGAQAVQPPASPIAKASPHQRKTRAATIEPGASISGAPPDLVRPLPAGVEPKLSTDGYVFPVYGPASFGDSFGAPRSDVAGGWHHGEDVFAPLATPLLAVASGTVHSVGWNEIGGWRFWLRDEQGNEFYYAHLSAYSPLAQEGTRVRAGDVLGFMGKSGDAEHSLPHLHFEIHPAALQPLGYDGVIAPYPYLVAWRRAQDASFADGRTYVTDASGLPRAAAPAPGAILLRASDVSSTSGLVPGALQRVLAGGEPSGRRDGRLGG